MDQLPTIKTAYKANSIEAASFRMTYIISCLGSPVSKVFALFLYEIV